MGTIVWTTSGHYGDKSMQSVRVADTVIATVKAIGKGQITVAHVMWAINSQLTGADAIWQVTRTQVRRVLNDLTKRWAGFRANGHGVYRWL